MVLSGCANESEVTDKNYVDLSERSNVDQLIGDESASYHVLSSHLTSKYKNKYQSNHSTQAERLSDDLVDKSIRAVDSDTSTASMDIDALDEQLVVGFPLSGLNKKYLFGGVITNVLGTNSDDYGRLKLSDLPALHVEADVVQSAQGESSFVMVGCAGPCSAINQPRTLIQAPVLGLNDAGTHAIVDLSVLGSELNLFELVKGPDSPNNPVRARTISSKTIRADFSDSTLIFDIDTKIRTSQGENVTMIARWYLKDLEQTRLPDFKKRRPNTQVGFFTPVRNDTYISRLATIGDGLDQKVKYYIKNVPQEYRPGFEAAIAEWNISFFNQTGEELLEYEFLETNDPRSKLIIAGDIRYNVIEWDLVNQAPYGGFGPSIPDYETGQIISANVLVQGPSIVKLYKSWFEVAENANLLASNGFTSAATNLREQFVDSIESSVGSDKTFELSLGELAFSIKAQGPEYLDPIKGGDVLNPAAMERRLDFFDTPKGVDYEDYIAQYMQGLVTHEIGHNIGLRHNFRGNIGFSEESVGEVSSSIMEYLGRTQRHLSRISSYDLMAVQYGYMGVQPSQRGLYCTDDQVVSSRFPENSAECSRNDLGSDPYGYFKGVLQKAFDTITNKGVNGISDWTVEQMSSEVKNSAEGMAAYYSSAQATSSTWTNWDIDVNRPTSVRGIRQLVVADLESIICDEQIEIEIRSKSSRADRQKIRSNIEELKSDISQYLSGFGLPTRSIVSCN